MKYQKMKSVGKMFGHELGNRAAKVNGVTFDYIVPVPLHKAKYRDRTYNQSEYIAKGIHEVIGGEAIADGIIRTRYTGTQTKLNKAERKVNVSDAFKVNPKYLEKFAGKNIIVVDDVITTGATILECASALKKSGAGSIWVCSAAYAELKITN
jgi:ComF family protein